jgi:tetratricopeptide (TPR) repeat protein
MQLKLGEKQLALASYQRRMDMAKKWVDAEPDNIMARLTLCRNYETFGRMEQSQFEFAKAKEWFEKSLALIENWQQLHPTVVSVKLESERLARNIVFCEVADKSISDLDFAVKQSPDLIPELLQARVRYWHHKRNHAEVIASAVKLCTAAEGRFIQGNVHSPGSNLYNAACGYALASTCPDTDAKTKEEDATKAVTLLKEARQRGYFKRMSAIKLAMRDVELDALRQRDDFKALLAELEKDAK